MPHIMDHFIAHPVVAIPPVAEPVVAKPAPRRIVLCFDGTRNKFTGDETDTNIVKIFKMLKRDDPNQFHYYQPGIGSYVEGAVSNTSKGHFWTRARDWCVETYDEMFGVSFVHHVLAGYKFLMRFYNKGDKIYIFGFSRGAYTARYLAEMIQEIGLLSQGNEEMVRFAWDSFSDHKLNKQTTEGNQFLHDFKDTFCRLGVKVHFLGLFDCVNSVADIQGAAEHQGSTEHELSAGDEHATEHEEAPSQSKWPAEHVRHAVSAHERRVLFLPSLFLLNPNEPEDPRIKEVYFAGNHGDVGGGWAYEKEDEKPAPKFLLSDIALKWMVDEVTHLDQNLNDLPDEHRDKLHQVLQWQPAKLSKLAEGPVWLQHQKAPHTKCTPEDGPMRKLMHDPVARGRGSNWMFLLFWWILEISPFTAYSSYDCKKEEWVVRRWAPHFGAIRDIPAYSTMHESVQQLHHAGILIDEEVPEEGHHQTLVWDPVGLFKSKFSWWSGKQNPYSKVRSPKLA